MWKGKINVKKWKIVCMSFVAVAMTGCLIVSVKNSDNRAGVNLNEINEQTEVLENIKVKTDIKVSTNVDTKVSTKVKTDVSTNVSEKVSIEEKVKNVLENYFSDFLSTLQEDKSNDYTHDDFSGVSGYIIAKNMVFLREANRLNSIGIEKVNLTGIDIEKISEDRGSLIVKAYVKYNVRYKTDDSVSEDEQDNRGCLFKINLQKNNESYKITNLDNKAVETRMAKEAVENVKGTENKFREIDNYFASLLENVKGM